MVGRLGFFPISSWSRVRLVSDPGSLALLVAGDSMILWPLGSSFVKARKQIGLGVGALIGVGDLFFREALMTFVVGS